MNELTFGEENSTVENELHLHFKNAFKVPHLLLVTFVPVLLFTRGRGGWYLYTCYRISTFPLMMATARPFPWVTFEVFRSFYDLDHSQVDCQGLRYLLMPFHQIVLSKPVILILFCISHALCVSSWIKINRKETTIQYSKASRLCVHHSEGFIGLKQRDWQIHDSQLNTICFFLKAMGMNDSGACVMNVEKLISC